jgi:hypothetical protein
LGILKVTIWGNERRKNEGKNLRFLEIGYGFLKAKNWGDF